VYSLGLNNTQRISFKLIKSRIKIYDASNRGPLDVKWRGLDFTFLLKYAIKFVTLSKLIAVFTPRIAYAKIGVLQTAKVRCQNLRAECHGPDSSAVFNRTAAVRSKGVIKHQQSSE
jgi:hypothetical protein